MLRPNWGRKSGGGTVSEVSAISLRSPPAQNARSPAPVSTATLALSSALNRRMAPNSPSRTALLSALRASAGRSSARRRPARPRSGPGHSLLFLLPTSSEDGEHRPLSTCAPTEIGSAVTTPGAGAWIVCSIFIASMARTARPPGHGRRPRPHAHDGSRHGASSDPACAGPTGRGTSTSAITLWPSTLSTYAVPSRAGHVHHRRTARDTRSTCTVVAVDSSRHRRGDRFPVDRGHQAVAVEAVGHLDRPAVLVGGRLRRARVVTEPGRQACQHRACCRGRPGRPAPPRARGAARAASPRTGRVVAGMALEVAGVDRPGGELAERRIATSRSRLVTTPCSLARTARRQHPPRVVAGGPYPMTLASIES